MKNEIARLCSLIQGQIFMPIKYQNELREIVNRSDFKFYEIPGDDNKISVKESKLENIY